MRILHISKYSYPERGGIETFVRDLTAEQVKMGHSVSVLCHHTLPFRKTDARQIDGVKITRSSTICNTAFAPISPFFPMSLQKIVSLHRPQIIHIHLPNPAILFNCFFPSEIPYIVHWHADVKGSPNLVIKILYPFYRQFEQRILSKAKCIIATSPLYLESSHSLRPWLDKCRIVPLGLDQNKYPPRQIPPDETPLVLSVGRFAFYKGFKYLVRAAVLLPEARFIIAGDGPEHSRITREVKKLGLENRVSLPGKISDRELFVLLQRASVFCLPSIDRGEAFGMVLLEAMRYGVPLVTTSINGSGTSWVNQNGITGTIVPVASSEALAEAIKEIITQPQKAVQYGQAGKLKFNNLFTILRSAQAIEQIYLDVISQ
ncbi:glycosyltransferase [Desulfovibrio gilichinskyi]|uniref:Glycosyltransferase involved in cell wall bisynthesis n=1 Tax=Desulfovibrio gilichinskyi TaxID=1519643 RepID=A0A1X7EJ32_9BACT|nr:glycosyltransferase [Desulfovibrio gilichinskyi]SMF34690.1 Glycosyltransferase involved in cell wall bisynthesis [Desulfovibrio gilichinskyi]